MDRDALIAQYRTAADAFAAAFDGLTEAQLDHQPADGGWTARKVAHHVADSETNSYIRLRRLVAEDDPLIIGYDEELWSSRLHYDRPVASALAVVVAVRAASLDLLLSLSPEEWDRKGRHSEAGEYTLDRWLSIYANHPLEHAQQVRDALLG
ncbi:MAG: DinB family protein [Chloroflexota bacterium]